MTSRACAEMGKRLTRAARPDDIMEVCMVDGLFQIEDGCPLTGEITVRRAKNLVPKAMVAALLGSTPSVLRNVPPIRDADMVSGPLGLHGVSIDYGQREDILQLDPSKVESAHMAGTDAHADSSRIPILFCDLLLHHLGEAFIPGLGGCRVGDHPIDFHLEILRQFGVAIGKQAQGIRPTAPHGLKETVIEPPCPSVGTAKQTLLTAMRAHELTEPRNAAVESEIMGLVDVLQRMGAIASVDIDRIIHIEGIDELCGYTHSALPDHIETASRTSAALATRGDVFVRGAHQSHMTTFLNAFRKMGGTSDVTDEDIHFYHPGGDLKPVIAETDVHPDLMTDWQQPLVVALTQVQGLSVVHETVYKNHFGFAGALCKMGATIQVYRECLGGTECRFGQHNFYRSAVISGSAPLTGVDIVVPDLRGGFSHLIAALTTEGTNRVEGVNLIDHGYEYFMSRLELPSAAVARLA